MRSPTGHDRASASGEPPALHSETPLGGVELRAVHPTYRERRPAWEAATFATRRRTEKTSHAEAMLLATVLSFVIGVATFVLTTRWMESRRADRLAATVAAAPPEAEYLGVPSRHADLGLPRARPPFVATGDVLAPPEAPRVRARSAAPPASAPARGPSVRKGKNQVEGTRRRPD